MPELTETQSAGDFSQFHESGNWARKGFGKQAITEHHVLALKKLAPGSDN
jgi:hypothetical protein